MKLTDEEFNAVEKVLAKSRMCESFDIKEDKDGNDCFYDFENTTQFSLRSGIRDVCDGLVEPTLSELNRREQLVLQNLFLQFGFTNKELDDALKKGD